MSGSHKAELDPLLACELAVSGHSANAAQALANKQIEVALTSLDKAITLCEACPTIGKDADSQFRLVARLVEICRVLCHKFRPNKVNEALKLIERVARIEQPGIH